MGKISQVGGMGERTNMSQERLGLWGGKEQKTGEQENQTVPVGEYKAMLKIKNRAIPQKVLKIRSRNLEFISE